MDFLVFNLIIQSAIAFFYKKIVKLFAYFWLKKYNSNKVQYSNYVYYVID